MISELLAKYKIGTSASEAEAVCPQAAVDEQMGWVSMKVCVERETERETERQRERESETERDRERQRETERKERERQRERQRE